MRFSIYLLLFAISCVHCKTHVKALTESMGQEVIEIGSPIKDLPPGLDEEPSAEFEEDEKTTIVPPTTKRETRKTTTLPSTTVTLKVGSERRFDNLSPEDEERRIEKELSEIYKDTDYKAETSKSSSTAGNVEGTLPALRQRGRANFKFQPDVNDRADVERFRTSVDDISCEKRVTQRLHDMVSIVVLEQKRISDSQDLKDSVVSATGRLLRNSIAMCLAFVSTLVCQ